jgi:hypothetical protein
LFFSIENSLNNQWNVTKNSLNNQWNAIFNALITMIEKNNRRFLELQALLVLKIQTVDDQGECVPRDKILPFSWRGVGRVLQDAAKQFPQVQSFRNLFGDHPLPSTLLFDRL